ncbi:hypothetical protein BSKO_13589 [Bryopsis sp. KO-2023]|nr:hypothetical protein BSKO_13589 [Bryopsis sp. KO-2023]
MQCTRTRKIGSRTKYITKQQDEVRITKATEYIPCTLTSATSDQLHKAISGMLKGGTSHQVTSYNHRIEQLSCNPGIVAAHHEGTRACTRTRPDIGRTVSYLQHTHTHTTR